jgi:hypothetical protein
MAAATKDEEGPNWRFFGLNRIDDGGQNRGQRQQAVHLWGAGRMEHGGFQEVTKRKVGSARSAA